MWRKILRAWTPCRVIWPIHSTFFHWIARDWYYHFSQPSNPIWKQGALLSINFLAASAGAVIILLVVDQPFAVKTYSLPFLSKKEIVLETDLAL